MRWLSYAILVVLLVVLVFAFFQIQNVQYRIEHPNVLICNGIVIDEKMKERIISFGSEYIEQKVGNQYFNDHFSYQGYSIGENCVVRLNYLYTVRSYTQNVFVDIIPGFILSVKDSNAPNYPFEIFYGPNDFNIKYDNYDLKYDPNKGFYYVFYKDGVEVGIGNAMSGKLIKEELVV